MTYCQASRNVYREKSDNHTKIRRNYNNKKNREFIHFKSQPTNTHHEMSTSEPEQMNNFKFKR